MRNAVTITEMTLPSIERRVARQDEGVVTTPAAPFVHAVLFQAGSGDYSDELPAFRALKRVELDPRVT